MRGFRVHRFYSIINFCGTQNMRVSYFNFHEDISCIIVRSFHSDALFALFQHLEFLQRYDWYDYENKFQIIDSYMVILPKGYNNFTEIKKLKLDKDNKLKFKKIFYE